MFKWLLLVFHLIPFFANLYLETKRAKSRGFESRSPIWAPGTEMSQWCNRLLRINRSWGRFCFRKREAEEKERR